MKSIALKAFPRTLGRRAGCRTLRAAGRVPAVIYGKLNQPQNLEINLQDIRDVVHGAASENVLLNLTVQGDAQPNRLAIIQEIQHHVLSNQVLHLDLHEVAENEKVILTVPVDSVGEALGVKTGGGTLEHVLFKLKVRALPKDLPESLVLDVSHLEIGQAIHIGDIKAPPGVEILGDKHISVLAVAAPISEAQEAAVLEAATAAVGEVEMIKEKKEEGAEGEAKPEAALKPGEQAPLKPGEKAALKPGEKAALKPGEKVALKPGDKAAPPPSRKSPRTSGARRGPRKGPREGDNFIGGATPRAGVARQPARAAWTIYILLRDWAIPAGNTPAPGIISGLCWWHNWPPAGARRGCARKSSVPVWRGWNGMENGSFCASRRRS